MLENRAIPNPTGIEIAFKQRNSFKYTFLLCAPISGNASIFLKWNNTLTEVTYRFPNVSKIIFVEITEPKMIKLLKSVK